MDRWFDCLKIRHGGFSAGDAARNERQSRTKNCRGERLGGGAAGMDSRRHGGTANGPSACGEGDTGAAIVRAGRRDAMRPQDEKATCEAGFSECPQEKPG